MRRGVSCKTRSLLTWQEGTRVRLRAQTPVRRANPYEEEQRCGHHPPGDQPQNCRVTVPRNGASPSRVACPRSLTQLVVRRWQAGLWLLFSFLIDPVSFLSDAGPARCPLLHYHGNWQLRFRNHLWYSGKGALSWTRGRFHDDVGSTRRCANTERSALPLSTVLVLACCLPDVTPSVPGKHEVDDFLGVHTTLCWCQAASGRRFCVHRPTIPNESAVPVDACLSRVD